MDVETHLTDEKLDVLYNTFDQDGCGSVTPQDLKNAFTKFGREISDEELA